MNWHGWLLWGFVATAVLDSLLTLSQAVGFTRINLPFLLGTLATPNRDRAMVAGFALHLVNGWLFALLYVAVFQSIGAAGWERGAVMGLIHGLVILTGGLRLLGACHPRMASERQGPTVTRHLEPPGWLALNYGVWTPVSILLAHAVYGAILGAFYRVAG